MMYDHEKSDPAIVAVKPTNISVTYPRWEPCARIGLARICAGGAR